MSFLVHAVLFPLFVFVSVSGAGVPQLNGLRILEENADQSNKIPIPTESFSKILSAVTGTFEATNVPQLENHQPADKTSEYKIDVSLDPNHNSKVINSNVQTQNLTDNFREPSSEKLGTVKEENETFPGDEKVLKWQMDKEIVLGDTNIQNKKQDDNDDKTVPFDEDIFDNVAIEAVPVVPKALNLKLSESHIQQVNSVLIPISPVSSTETNDISPEVLNPKESLTNDGFGSTSSKAEQNNSEPSLKASSARPKQRSKPPADKKPEVKINSIEDNWRDLEKKFRSYTDNIMKKALPKFLRIHSELNVSSQCNGAFLQMVHGLRNFKSWAIKMVDASGRLPSGSLDGTLTDLGDYDQCLDVSQPKRNKHSEIKGQYCTLELKPILPALQNSVTLNTKVLDFGNSTSKDSVLSDLSHGSALFHFMVMRIGVCVPSSCVADDIRELAAELLKKVPIQVFVRNCETKQDVHITIPQFVVISTAVIIGFLIVAGTCIDGYVSRNLSKSKDIGRVPQSLLAFSMTANIRQLFRTSKRSSTLLSVNGIRCLSLMWIVLAHTYGFGHRQGLARLSHAKTYMDDVLFQIITNAWVSVDTFFLLGGLLVAFSNLKVIEHSGGRINFVSHVLHRIWRLTPPLAATLGVMFLLPLIGSGPLWADMVGQKVANCEKRWWQVFLPINTWIDFGSMCLLHTWYIAADIHFYCLAPLALLILYRWPVIGFALLFLLTAVCSLITGLLTIVNDLPPTVIFFSPDVELTKRTANLIYFRPYPHIGAYCVGLGLGYILWKYRKFSLSKFCQGTGWLLSSVSCLAVLFATYSWSRGQSADPAEGVTYAVLHRTVWAAGVAWVLFACATGHGGLLNKFLSWQLFAPLSKLCYSVYLLHFPVLWVRVSWRRSLLNFHHYDIVTEFFGILMITLGLSIIFHLTFEAPFLKLEQIWFPERGRSTKIVKPLDDKATT